MGTKNNPGRFDCYASAGPDEQMFVLLERDPLAPFLVSIWSSVRYGDFEAAQVKFATMLQRAGARYAATPDVEKASEALDCAMAMFAAQRNRRQVQPSQLMQCSGCRYVTDDPRAVTCCKGYCYDSTGKSCDSWPCPNCGRHHYWCGSISPEDVANFREGRQ